MSGCGHGRLPTAPVEGKVLYQGMPLEFGVVLFFPETGPIARGPIRSDGTFRLSTYSNGDGAVLGVYRVQIACYEGQRPGAAQTSGGGERRIGKSLIPAKYANYATSGLTVKVSSKNEPLVFDLK
jgi:hypothetical protein